MTPLPSEQEEVREEGLADIYECLEEGLTSRDQIEPLVNEKVRSGVFADLASAGLILLEGGAVSFSPEATRVVTSVIRRKRLAERLLKDILNVADEFIDPEACQWEHTLSPEVTSSICTLLGHPSQSPFDKLIPPGECCHNGTQTTAPILSSLDKMDRGEEAKIVYLLSAKNPELNRLLAMGLTPGSTIKVIQRFPTFVVQVGQSQLAFDELIAGSIFVHPL